MKKLLLIINPKAGIRRKYRIDQMIITRFRNAGYHMNVRYTRKRKDGTALVGEWGNGVDLIVCMGGDGTLNEVVEGIMDNELDVPLGYIPSGSTNDFAGSIGLSMNPIKAANFIMNNEPRPLDIGKFNGRHFVYTAACGIFSSTSYTTSQMWKNKLGHLAYIFSGIGELFSMKKMKLSFKTDAGKFKGNYLFAAINNTTTVGGVMKLDKDIVSFDDGYFELMLVEFPKSVREFLHLLRKVFHGEYRGNITFTQITRAKIKDESDVDWSLDGEHEHGQKKIEFEVLKDAIKLIY